MSVDWVTYSNEEIEELILKFSKEGKSASEIGVTLKINMEFLVLKQ